MAKDRPFHAVGDILKKILPKDKWASQQKKYALWNQWDRLVGKAVAGQAVPLRWSKNTLVVGVNDSCWLQDLRMREGEILERIRKGQPDLQIDRIRWIIQSSTLA